MHNVLSTFECDRNQTMYECFRALICFGKLMCVISMFDVVAHIWSTLSQSTFVRVNYTLLSLSSALKWLRKFGVFVCKFNKKNLFKCLKFISSDVIWEKFIGAFLLKLCSHNCCIYQRRLPLKLFLITKTTKTGKPLRSTGPLPIFKTLGLPNTETNNIQQIKIFSFKSFRVHTKLMGLQSSDVTV